MGFEALLFLALAGAGEGAAVQERELRLSEKKVHYLEAGNPTGLTVLLLHGARYDSETWRSLSDPRPSREGRLPRHRSGPSRLRPFRGLASRRGDCFSQKRCPLSGLDSAAIVSPSMSGQFSFPLLIRSPEKAAAFVPVAPAGSDKVSTSAEEGQGADARRLGREGRDHSDAEVGRARGRARRREASDPEGRGPSLLRREAPRSSIGSFSRFSSL